MLQVKSFVKRNKLKTLLSARKEYRNLWQQLFRQEKLLVVFVNYQEIKMVF